MAAQDHSAESLSFLSGGGEMLHVIIEASDLGIWELDLNRDELVYSDRYIEIFGYEKGTVVPHGQLLRHLHPEDKAIRDRAMEAALLSGHFHFESRLIRTDQAVRWMQVKGKVFYDEGKKPAKMIGTVRDITDERFHQQELQESEQKFRLLADSMPQLIWTMDPEANITYCNRSVSQYSGLSFTQIQQGGWAQILHPDELEENMAQWKDCLRTGKDFIREQRYRKSDGEYYWQLTRVVPQRDEAGNIQMWVGSSTNIQDQKSFTRKLENQVQERTWELKQKNIQLEKINTELESFAYVSSHDLQEPLRKIQTFASRLLGEEAQNMSQNVQYYVNAMQEAAKRMQRLIKDLLDYSLMNADEEVFQHTDLNGLLQEVQNELRERITEKQAHIQCNDLQSLRIIPFQFRQLLQNLLSNALKFSQPGRALEIRLNGEWLSGGQLKENALLQANVHFPDQPCYHLEISDNGIGFDPRYRQRIFELFQRLHNRSSYSGTGIGLAIVKKIVENHKGMIFATGALNEGARFDIFIPVS